MEPNTSSSPAAWTSTAALLLSPAFSPAPPSSPSLVPESGSGSGSSWCQQIPPSSPPAVGVGNGSLSVYAHATSSQSPPSSFPTTGTLPMVGYDLFGNPEATAATPLPTLPGGQWEQEGESSSRAAPVLPECSSPGLLGFAGEFAAWPPSEEIPSFFSPSSAGGLASQSSDHLVGFAQPSSDSDLASLPQILRIPSLAVEDSPVDAPLPLIEEEEEEEIDVSAFLVSDPEDQLPNASGTATSPQMRGDGGGGASASWMVPGSTGNNWPPTLAPAAESTCTMLSTSSASMPCHSGGSSVGVASSIVGGMMKPSPAVPPMPPLSQGAGASSSNFNGFAQPSSTFVLAPLAPPNNLQGPLLPVKQEVMEYAGATARDHPDFISLVDDDEDGLYEGAAIPCSFPGPVLYPHVPESSSSRGSLLALGSASGINGWARSSSWGGGGGSSSSPSFAPGSWGSSSSSSPSIAPGSWGGSSSSRSFAPGSWGSSSSPSFAPGSWGANSSSSPSFASGSWGGGSSSPSIAVSTPCFDRSTSYDNYGSRSMPKLSIRGKMASTPGLPPLPRLLRTSSSNGGGIVFTDAEMAIITKEKKLQDLLGTNPKKVKRILYNRAYSAVAKTRKVMRTKDLERLVVTLETERKSLYAELQSLEEGSAALKAKQMEMQVIIGELEQQAMLKDAVREVLKAEIQKLKHLKLNGYCTTWLTYKPSTRRGEPMHG